MIDQDPDTGCILPHEPTSKTRAEVSALYSFGIPQAEIATYIGVDAKTLRKHYREELDNSVTKANAAVGKFLYQNASGATLKEGASHSDCVRAAMFWAKTRMGWRETQDLNHKSEDGSMSPTRIEIVAPSQSNDNSEG